MASEDGPCTENVDPRSGFRAVFEDDGKTAYPYLCDPRGRIVGDVWIYNCGPARAVPEWSDPAIPDRRAAMPFANPRGFAEEPGIARVRRTEDLRFVWSQDPVTVTLETRRELAARAAVGSKPGWSRGALQDGPLAKVPALPLESPG